MTCAQEVGISQTAFSRFIRYSLFQNIEVNIGQEGQDYKRVGLKHALHYASNMFQ